MIEAGALPELSERLEVLGRLGQGGFAVVERARDRSTGREVALKLLHERRVEDPARLTRFYREGEVVARLEHPGIVRVHAAGTFHGQPCLVYELVEGARSLAEVLPELPLVRRLEALRDVARALGWAHARGVVHRDVKPENVLVDARGGVRLTDFGLAAAGDLERLTRSGAVLGTPYYMSPEQLTGSRGEVGPPSDVWALGVILYQALTERLPFAAQSLATLVAEVLSDSFAPPRRLSAEVSRDLETVCLTALRPSPGERYPDADAFAADLERVLAGEPPLARRRRKRPWRAGVVLLALALPAAAGGVLLRAPAPGGPGPGGALGDAPGPRAPVRTPGEELDELLAVSDPWARGAAVGAWLASNGEHPRAAQARQLLAAVAGDAPLHVLAWGPEGLRQEPLFLEGSRFVCASGGEPHVRRGEADAGRELSPWREFGTKAAPHPAAGFVLGVPGRLRWLVPAGEGLELRGEVACGAGYLAGLAVAPRLGLVAAGIDARVDVFRLTDGARVATLPLAGESVACLAFSPDERLLVAGGVRAHAAELESGTLQAWEVEGWRAGWRHTALDGFYCLAFSPDGRTLAAGTRSCLLLLVDPLTGSVRSLTGEGVQRTALGAVAHDRPVKGLAFSPDGRRLYSVASARDKEDSELGVWDVAAERMIRPVTRLPGWHLSTLAIDASGRRLAMATEEGPVVVWLTPP